MTNQEILTKAVEKAIANGWDGADNWWQVYPSYGNLRFERRSAVDGPGDYQDIEKVIYNHEFAKALWGEKPEVFPRHWLGDWQFHLQQMVIANDPIEYLKNNCPEAR